MSIFTLVWNALAAEGVKKLFFFFKSHKSKDCLIKELLNQSIVGAKDC
jgi:hypothetical protein